jgi:archaemetzincin
LKYFVLICSFITGIFISCNHSARNKAAAHSNTALTINLQPFTDISASDVQYVFTEIKKVYPYIELEKAIALPSAAFYPVRNRYRADSLIDYLNRITPAGHVTIGLTAKDISTTKNGIKDWGVMGLGFCPGNACVASTFRLTETKKLMQFFKVAIHELGHTQGLPHCEEPSCFMRDAEGKNPTNEEKDFCKKCKNFLIKKGWQFNT